MPTTRSPAARPEPAGAEAPGRSTRGRARGGCGPAAPSRSRRRDLEVGAADADGDRLDEDRPSLLGGLCDVVELGATRCAGKDGDRLQVRPPSRRRPVAAAASVTCAVTCPVRQDAGGGLSTWCPGALQRRLDPRQAVLVGETVGAPEQADRGVDQRDVRERLREVADQALGDRVVLLGEQADVVAQRRAAARTAPRPRRGARSAAGRRPARTSRPGTRPPARQAVDVLRVRPSRSADEPVHR